MLSFLIQFMLLNNQEIDKLYKHIAVFSENRQT